MSLNGILNTSLSGILTNQSALKVVSNNIANVNTPDYIRQRVALQSNQQGTQSAGVRIGQIESVVDRFLQTASRTAISNTQEFSVQREFHDRLQALLGRPDSEFSLSARLDTAFDALASLSLSPADRLQRQQALSELDNYLGNINDLEGQLQTLKTEVSVQIETSVARTNEILRQLHDLNPLLSQAQSVGGESGGVAGQAETLLSELSELVDIRVDEEASGQLTVRTGSGIELVGRALYQLQYPSIGNSQAETVFPPVQVVQVNGQTLQPTGTSFDLSNSIRSGRLQGLLDLRDNQLDGISESLGQLAARVRDTFNAVHNQFSATPAPAVLTGEPTIIAPDNPHGFTGSVTFAVIDSANQVSDTPVVIDFSDPSLTDFNDVISKVNTDLAGEGVLSLVNGALEFRATASGSGVVVQDVEGDPSQRAGRGFSHFFGLNNLITSDSSGIFETGVTLTDTHGLDAPGATGNLVVQVTGNNGQEVTTVSIATADFGSDFSEVVDELNSISGLGPFFNFSLNAQGRIIYEPTAVASNLNLRVLSDTTSINGSGIGVSEAFGLDENAVAVAARDLQIRSDISADPDKLALSVFDPAASLALLEGDQRGALALQNVQISRVRFEAAGEIQSGQFAIGEYNARLLGNIGLISRRVTNLEEDNQALRIELQERQQAVSGVNIDEELSNLVVYQNAYNASARVLSSVQELYDALLQAV